MINNLPVLAQQGLKVKKDSMYEFVSRILETLWTSFPDAV